MFCEHCGNWHGSSETVGSQADAASHPRKLESRLGLFCYEQRAKWNGWKGTRTRQPMRASMAVRDMCHHESYGPHGGCEVYLHVEICANCPSRCTDAKTVSAVRETFPEVVSQTHRIYCAAQATKTPNKDCQVQRARSMQKTCEKSPASVN